MSLITEEIRNFIHQQKLCYVATVCPDGTPNLSPKGTLRAIDDRHLVFADIHSPGTVENIKFNPALEINIVDIFKRKGYRFKGVARVIADGSEFDELIGVYGDTAKKFPIKNFVLVSVDRVLPVWSPAYDDGSGEEEIIERWVEYWEEIYPRD